MKKIAKAILVWIAIGACAVCLIRFSGTCSIPYHRNNNAPKGDNHLECSFNMNIDANTMKSIA